MDSLVERGVFTKSEDRSHMFELTYKDSYHVERTLKSMRDYEALMLALSGMRDPY